MEKLMQVAQKRRRRALEIIRNCIAQLVVDSTQAIGEDDMKKMSQRGQSQQCMLSVGRLTEALSNSCYETLSQKKTFLHIAICTKLPTNCWLWFTEWENDVDAWMNHKNLDVYYKAVRRGDNKTAHTLSHSAFRTYRFQLSGCPFTLKKLIQLDIVGNDCEHLTAALTQCIKDFLEYRESPEYAKAFKDSQQKGEKQRLHLHSVACVLFTMGF